MISAKTVIVSLSADETIFSLLLLAVDEEILLGFYTKVSTGRIIYSEDDCYRYGCGSFS